ncbi:GerW family sporulation protein [Chloroflexota bacterium]
MEGVTIIPLVSTGFMFGAGGGSGKESKKDNMEGWGGGTGGGVGIKPTVLVIIDKNGVTVEGERIASKKLIKDVPGLT